LCLATPLEWFSEEFYEGEWIHVGRYLSTFERQDGWSDHEFKRIEGRLMVIFFETGFYGNTQNKGVEYHNG